MLKILVIDEDSAMRFLILEWLRKEGYDVRSVPRLDAAMQSAAKAHSDRPDLAIVDLPHPRLWRAAGASDIDAVRISWPNAPVIGISTRLTRTLGRCSDEALALGLSMLLPKPCTREELLDAVVVSLRS